MTGPLDPPAPGSVRPGSDTANPPAPPPRRVGRPLKLDRPLLAKIVDTVRVGNYLKTAAAYCGVGYSTLLEWQQKGRDEQHRIAQGEDPDPENALFLELVESLTQAQAAAQVTALAYWRKAMSEPGNWRAAMEYLARTAPDEWGSSSTVRVSDADSEARIAAAADAAVSAFLHQGDGVGEYDPATVPPGPAP